MSTPDEQYEIAVDESCDAEERERAIDTLEAANECDRLATLVEMDDLADGYRRQALEALATPQCEVTLQRLVESGDLEPALRERADRLLDDVDDIRPA